MTNKQILNLLQVALALPDCRDTILTRLHSVFDEQVERERHATFRSSQVSAEEKQSLLVGEQQHLGVVNRPPVTFAGNTGR
jgi:hypothetical protein